MKRSVVLKWPNRAPFARPTHEDIEGISTFALGEHGLFCEGDNLAGLASLLPTHANKITLAYLDPPFLTQRTFEKKTRNTKAMPSLETAFDDHWTDRAAYLEALGARLTLIRDLLAPWGSVCHSCRSEDESLHQSVGG